VGRLRAVCNRQPIAGGICMVQARRHIGNLECGRRAMHNRLLFEFTHAPKSTAWDDWVRHATCWIRPAVHETEGGDLRGKGGEIMDFDMHNAFAARSCLDTWTLDCDSETDTQILAAVILRFICRRGLLCVW
jgi:hypothetical protein